MSLLPGWLAPLATALASARAEDLRGRVVGEQGRPAAVLIALAGPDTAPEPAVLLSRRASTLRAHAGQVAFPGGACDPGDADEVATALREAREEVALDPASVRVLATLPSLFIPPSGFSVSPVLAWWKHPHPVRARDSAEVDTVELVPLRELADPANRFNVRGPSGWVAPGFQASDLFVWGFTAGLLDAVLRLGGWERPWDTTAFRDLPQQGPRDVVAADGTPTGGASTGSSVSSESPGSAGSVPS